MNNEPDYDNLYFERTKMTRKVFQANNKDDVDLLLSILSEDVYKITQSNLQDGRSLMWYKGQEYPAGMYEIAIDWGDVTEITRPIPEATEADVGKLCKFWNFEESYIGILACITNMGSTTYYRMNSPCYEDLDFLHCRRLTQQEIEELI